MDVGMMRSHFVSKPVPYGARLAGVHPGRSLFLDEEGKKWMAS
jgi:hypothetical protein